MKVLMLNGSPDKTGCIARAFEEIEMILHEQQIETEVLQMGR